MQIIAGIDIGGTKSAVSFARYADGGIEILDKVKRPTRTADYHSAFHEYIEIIQTQLKASPDWRLCSIGISCGGPLDAEKGIIMPVMLQNDADACALAEWRLGAGKGTKNMVFLTFGTGMGAGMILNGQLYQGATCMAGEVGHIRLEKDGPYGYGKNGSFEGFCSGGGIANLGRMKAQEALEKGVVPSFCKSMDMLPQVDCKEIGRALEEGDATAREIFDIVAEYLGRGLSILIDILNPDMIVLGSIYARQREALEPGMQAVIAREALAASGKACKIVPATLGEMIGDYAAVSVGMKAYDDFYR